jgi:Uma2 family endonuclease
MSTANRPRPPVLPLLAAGQRLDRATFHERYEMMPPGTRAELIGGIVYMPSPLSFDHGKRDGKVSDWLGRYEYFTSGVERALNATVMLDEYGEPQPDCLLLLSEGLGGQTRIVDGYVLGAPELVVEVSKSTRATDLGPKKKDYERTGVREYLFVGIEPDEIRWFRREGETLVEVMPDPDGVYRSQVFPGLWLDPEALLRGDMPRVFATLDLGLATPEHAKFVEQLADASRGVRADEPR